jgi:hypothetical protein
LTKSLHADRLISTDSATDALCKDLIQGLHAASQPLTILRASLGVSGMAEQSPEDMRRLLKQSEKEVDRLCQFFNYLQQFVVVESVKAEPEIENLPRLLMHTVEGVDLLFAEAGISLAIQRIEEFPPFVFLDSSRFEQALSTILLVALGRAARGDEVLVTNASSGDFIEISLRQALIGTTSMAADVRLSLALAAANLRSQGAELAWQEHPFTARIALPVAKSPVLA